MADITVYKPAASTIAVFDANPPVDQSAEVAALTAQNAALQSALDAANAKIAAARTASDVLQAALA